MAVRVATTRRAPSSERWLPHAVIATTFVVVLPAVLVSLLVPAGSLALLALSLLLGVALSLAAASVGGAIWSRLPGSQDRVFADLMLWGWLRRSIAERRLAQAEKLLGADPQGASLEALIDLSELLEARDARTYGHSQRVTRHAERIATAMGLPAAEVAKVRTAAALHDIGKLHTPRSILNKPGRLTDSEFALIKRHPVDGAVMASGIGDPEISAMIRHHHERLDGRGYPDGAVGRGHPRRRAHHLRRRHVRRDHLQPHVPARGAPQARARRARGRGRQAARRRRGGGVPRLLPRASHRRAVGAGRLRAAAAADLARRRLPGDRGGRGGRDRAADGRRQPAAGRLLPHEPRLAALDHRRRRAEARERRGGVGDPRPHRPRRTRGAGRRGASAAVRAAMAHARMGGRSSRLPAAGRPRPGRRSAAAVAAARRTRPRRLPRPATTGRSCPTSRSRP